MERKNNKKKKGFTLIELIIVIAIIGILGAIAVPKFGNIQGDAKDRADKATAKVIADTTLLLTSNGKLKSGESEGAGVYIAGEVFKVEETEKTPGKVVSDYMQNPPKLQNKSVENDAFYVLIDAEGNVKVFSKNVSEGEIYNKVGQLYPEIYK